MAQDEIVSKLNSFGRFTDCYVAELSDGDEYVLNPKAPLPTVTAEKAIKYINDRKISIHPVDDQWSFRKNSIPFYTGDAGMSLMECLCYIIEMEEL
jgi:hypothetical protein